MDGDELPVREDHRGGIIEALAIHVIQEWVAIDGSQAQVIAAEEKKSGSSSAG